MTNRGKIFAFIIIFCISIGTISIAQDESINLNSIPKKWSEIIETNNFDDLISDEDKTTPIWKYPSIITPEESKKDEENNTQYTPCNQNNVTDKQHCAPGWGR